MSIKRNSKCVLLSSKKKSSSNMSTMLLMCGGALMINLVSYLNRQTKMPRNHPGHKAGQDLFHVFQKKVQIKILCLL